MRKFNVGDMVITKDHVLGVANGSRTISTACRKITSAIETLGTDDQIIYEYYLIGVGHKCREIDIFPANDAKRMVMTTLASRMQAVAEMEVPQ